MECTGGRHNHVHSFSGLSACAGPIPRPVLRPQQFILAGLLFFEIAIFSCLGSNFFSWNNFFEITRNTVELGLLALAMTPVIVTGGIDLSVGSLMSLLGSAAGKNVA